MGTNIEIAAKEAEKTVVTCTNVHDEDIVCVPEIKEMKDTQGVCILEYYKIFTQNQEKKVLKLIMHY